MSNQFLRVSPASSSTSSSSLRHSRDWEILVRKFPAADDVAEHACKEFLLEAERARLEQYPIVFILPTGSTPEGMYARIAAEFAKGEVKLAHVVTFNMDEYEGLAADHPQSYRHYMRTHFFSHVDEHADPVRGIRTCNIHIPDGMAQDAELHAAAYRDALLDELQRPRARLVLFGGIGTEPAHIAFNDLTHERPFNKRSMSDEDKTDAALNTSVRLVELDEGTRRANACHFGGVVEDVPKRAFTIGFREIFEAQRAIILATGEKKQGALLATLRAATPTWRVPASLLRWHRHVEFFVDRRALALTKEDMREGDMSKFSLQESKGIKTDLWGLTKVSKPAVVEHEGMNVPRSVNSVVLPNDHVVVYFTDAPNAECVPSIVERLRRRGNQVIVEPSDSHAEVVPAVKPNLIILHSDDPRRTGMLSTVRSYLAHTERSAPLPVLEFDTGRQDFNMHIPLTDAELQLKMRALKDHERSQVERTPFDEEVREMATAGGPDLQGEFYCADEDDLVPPGQPGDMVIVAAPHPDDAEIGVGGLLAKLKDAPGVRCVVANCTTGHHAPITKKSVLDGTLPDLFKYRFRHDTDGYVEDADLRKYIRRGESVLALRALNPNIQLEDLELPFYDRPNYHLFPQDYKRVERFLHRWFALPDYKRVFVFIPDKRDMHAAHRATTRLFTRALDNCKGSCARGLHRVFYRTPWFGRWQLYDFSPKCGSRLNALVGGELLLGTGSFSASLGWGSHAERYRIIDCDVEGPWWVDSPHAAGHTPLPSVVEE